jgi:hypothetical protein
MKKIIIILFTVHFSLFTFHSSKAQVIHVPADQPTIQAGIGAATDGDTVLVANGTYLENINFLGKAITVCSNFLISSDTNDINATIIDGSQPSDPDNGSVITFEAGEDTTSVLCGFTITGGTGSTRFFYNANGRIGGGLLCYLTGARIVNNKIINNHVENTGWAGGGALCQYATTQEHWIVLRNNVLTGNSCISSTLDAFGGGIYVNANLICEENDVALNICTGTGNANADGGGIEFEELSTASLVFLVQNNAIHNNSVDGSSIYGVGMTFYGGEGTVSGNNIHHNTGTAVSSAVGGGLRLLASRANAYVTNNEISSNSLAAENPVGGGMDVGASGKNIYIQDNTIQLNSLVGSNTAWGGGVNLSQDLYVMVSNNYFIGNTVQGSQWCLGAGLSCDSPKGIFQCRNNVFYNNSGSGTGIGGGIGIYDNQPQSVEIEGNRFENNLMDEGGGLWTFNSYEMTVSNNIFKGNTGVSTGGAMQLRQYTGQLSDTPAIKWHDAVPGCYIRTGEHPLIINNTFLDNSSNLGGAIYSDHQAEFPLILNSIFSKNEAINGHNIYSTSLDTLIISYCDIDTITDASIYGHWKGTDNFNASPGFIDDACHIDQFSPCVDAGTDSLEFSGTWYYAPDIDFEGTIRPWNNGRIDVGADECDIFTKIPGLLVSNNAGIFLSQNRPNPCTNSTQIGFLIPNDGFVSLKVCDMAGREIETLVSGQFEKGEHTYTFHAADLQNGIYFYKLSAGNKVMTRKMVINK